MVLNITFAQQIDVVTMKKLLLYLLLLGLLPNGLFAQKDKNHLFEAAKNMELFNAVYKNLDLMYVDTLDANDVIGTGIKSMLRSLDPYTEYYPESETQELRQALSGKYGGIGALIRYNQQLKNAVIDEPYANMPSSEVGLKKGDIILQIDDSTMVGKDTKYVSEHLRGEPGSTFALKIKRPSTGKVMKFKVKRRAIQMPAIPYYGMVAGKVGYINLLQYYEGCAKEVRQAFIDLKKQGAKGLILDLRNNVGGSEQEAVDLVNIFVPKDITVVTNKGKLKRANLAFKTRMEPVDASMPIVILVNGMTASASEITAGSLQDLDRAVIMGTRTFGKGLVQMTTKLPYNANMKVTTAHYYIPSGRCIQAINYKHTAGRNSATQLPDSLTSVFHTKNGREVRDGGGIMPDVEIKPDTIANISAYLQRGDSTETMFNYMVDYISKHKTIAPASEFTLTDAEYNEFKQLVLKNKFTYDPGTEKILAELEKMAKFEKYYEDAKPEFEALKKKLTHDVAKDLELNKDELKQMIATDIVTAYYFQAGAVQLGLRYDKQTKEAIKLLQMPEEYNKLLMPKK